MAPLPSILLPNHNSVTFGLLRGAPPNRICFATAHQNALKANAPEYAARYPYVFGVPFQHGVAAELAKTTGINLYPGRYGPWARLSDEQAETVRTWMLEQGTRTYLKDFFDCSISLGERSVRGRETELGALFSAAKYREDMSAVAEIATRLRQTWLRMKSLPTDGFISAPPPRDGKAFDLPTALAAKLAKQIGVKFVPLGTWKGHKGQLKDVAVDKKWKALDDIGFDVNPAIAASGGPVVLVDDIYQSGTTLNFLRASLTAKGIARASALAIVKAARDTDNQ